MNSGRPARRKRRSYASSSTCAGFGVRAPAPAEGPCAKRRKLGSSSRHTRDGGPFCRSVCLKAFDDGVPPHVVDPRRPARRRPVRLPGPGRAGRSLARLRRRRRPLRQPALRRRLAACEGRLEPRRRRAPDLPAHQRRLAGPAARHVRDGRRRRAPAAAGGRQPGRRCRVGGGAAVFGTPSAALGENGASVSFADTSSEDALGQLFVAHNDGGGVQIAHFDEADGSLRKQLAVPGTAGMTVESSLLATPVRADGSADLFFVAGDRLFKLPVANARQRGAAFGTAASTLDVNATEAGAPTLVHLTCSAPRPRTSPSARRTASCGPTARPICSPARSRTRRGAGQRGAHRDRAGAARRPRPAPGGPVDSAPVLYVKASSPVRSSAAPRPRCSRCARPRRAASSPSSGRCSPASRAVAGGHADGRAAHAERQAARGHVGQPVPRLHARPRRRRQLRHQLLPVGRDDRLPADDRRGLGRPHLHHQRPGRAARGPGQRRQAGDRPAAVRA